MQPSLSEGPIVTARKRNAVTREGRVYRCSWSAEGGRFQLWVTDSPAIAVEASSFQEADELLYEAIMHATGDGENLKEYDPPAPLAAGGVVRRTLTRVSPVKRVEIANEADLFDGGLCKVCRMPLGPRSSAPILVKAASRSLDGMRLRGAHPILGVSLSGFSKTFHQALSPQERKALRWRPILLASGKETTFVELLGGTVHAPFVVLKSIGVTLTECPACGWRRAPFYSVEPPTPALFIASAALPAKMATAMTIGSPLEPQLCVVPARWKALGTKRVTRQLVSDAIGVVDDFAIESAPAYETD